MNFALLGGDPLLKPLLRAIARDPQHMLQAAACVPAEFRPALLETSPGVLLLNSWDELLSAGKIDWLIAVPAEERTEEGVKQLASAGIPLLLQPPSDPASSLLYELSLVRDDTGVPVVSLFPLRFHPQLRRLREFLAGSPARLVGLQWERFLHHENDPPLMSAAEAYRALMYDVDMLRQLGGEYSQVTAVFSGFDPAHPRAEEVSLATVTLAGAGHPTATWILRPGSEADRFRLTLTAEKGTLCVEGHLPPGEFPEGESARLAITRNNQPVVELQPAGDIAAPSELLRELARGVETPSANADWKNVMRNFEVVEAASRSIRRRRTIDLHFETTSERSQFKTQMTAIGCGLLSMTLISTIFLLLVENVFHVHAAVMYVAWIGIFGTLVLFLLLQLLLFVARPAGTRSATAPEAAGKDGPTEAENRPSEIGSS